jgi:NADPH:quinone reductase-like Zn-dependent oxidoreductase
VFGQLSRCGFGAYAEFAAAPEQAMALKPANLSFEEAAASGGSNRQLADALLLGPVLSMGRQKFGNLLVKPNQADLLFLKELCEAGKIRPAIDRRFRLREVADAVRYVEDGRARGKSRHLGSRAGWSWLECSVALIDSKIFILARVLAAGGTSD